MTIAFIKDNVSLSLNVSGRSFSITDNHPNFKQICAALKQKDEAKLLSLLDVAKTVEARFNGKVQVANGQVLCNGEPIHGVVVDRIFEFMRDGLPFEPLVKFLENLMGNPSKASVDQLYTFLEHRHLPITEDGCFLGYKGVRTDYRDIFSGRFDNSPGKTCKMERNQVDDDKNVHCSLGLHVGTLEYAQGYAGAGRKVMVVKVNPKNCVSVPTDASFQKLRTCEYEVLYECTNALDLPLYSSAGKENDWENLDDETCENCGGFPEDCYCSNDFNCGELNCEICHPIPEIKAVVNQKWLVVDKKTGSVITSRATRELARDECDNEFEKVELNEDWTG